MRIYAIRDRLLDYFQQPFIAQGDKPVLGAISNQLHNGGNIDWQNAPHHFEIWRLGKVNEEGHIEQDRELIATLDSLVRADLRHPNRKPGVEESEIPPSGRRGSPGVDREDPYPSASTLANKARTAPEPPKETREGADRVHPGADGTYWP